jgi:DnaK suppressor protein
MIKINFPEKLLQPIKNVLHLEEEKLSKRKKQIEKEDPFSNPERVLDNADSGGEAAEQTGHSNAEGLKKEIDKRIIQIRKALSRIKLGKYGICEKCGKMIDTDRLSVFPEATLCIKCQKEKTS